jgi:nucleoside-diphosphate-sugar epimerase
MPAAALRDQTVLVTGATGFIGYHVCERLVSHNIVTYGLSRSASAATLPIGVQALAVDLTHCAEVLTTMQHIQPAYVIHLAAVGVATAAVPIDYAQQINVIGTENLLHACRDAGVQRFVHVGTAYESGPAVETDPPYVRSKMAAWSAWQRFVHQHHLDSIAVRLYHVFGPRQSTRGLIGGAIRAALSDEVFQMTAGQQVRDFVYVADVVDALLAAATADDVQAKTYDIGTGLGRSVLSVVQTIFRIVGGHGALQPGALPYRPGENLQMLANIEPAVSDLGWRGQIDFEDGLLETIAYQREHAATH